MAGDFTKLSDDFYVSPQITPKQVDAAKAQGIALIINNRPDGEEWGQPTGAEIEAAAKSAGIAYVAIPITGVGINDAHLDQFDAAVAAAMGPILGYCRSGTRSTVLRAYARARAGDSADDIIREAAEAGYNISGQRGPLVALGAKA